MKKYTVSDSKLVSLYKEGHEEAFEQLVNRHRAKIFTAIYMIVKDECIAEDILQETFIKVVNTIKSGRYNEEGKFLPWVMRIAHNLSIDHFRKSRRYPTIIMEDGNNVFNTLDFSEDSAESIQIKRDMDRLAFTDFVHEGSKIISSRPNNKEFIRTAGKTHKLIC